MKKKQHEEGLAAPERCADNSILRPDGGLKSPAAAESTMRASRHPDSEADLEWVNGCYMNQGKSLKEATKKPTAKKK